MNIIRLLLLIVVILVALALNASAGQGIIRMSDRQNVGFAGMITDVAKADTIFIGEVHDQQKHHDMALEVIRALQAKKLPLAIGLEMFQSDSQQMLDDWSAGKMSEDNFKLVYSRNWSYDWSLYQDILIFARDNHIPLVALNIPKQIVTMVARQGFASLSAEDKKNLPPEVTCELNTPYTELMNKFFSPQFKHVAKGKNFTFFCEAQALRNNGMAWNMSRFLQKNPGRKIVTIAGFWHAVKSGAPAQLAQYSKQTTRVILPEMAEFGPQNATAGEADYLVLK